MYTIVYYDGIIIALITARLPLDVESRKAAQAAWQVTVIVQYNIYLSPYI